MSGFVQILMFVTIKRQVLRCLEILMMKKILGQNEETPMVPNSPYGVAKLAAHNLCRVYRLSYNLHVSCGILMNHESPRRGDDFVTKKIVNYVKAKDFSQPLRLGNIDAYRDWGHAKDFVRAMPMMLRQEKPDDYVVATGEVRSVYDFLTDVKKLSGVDFSYVCDPHLRRPL